MEIEPACSFALLHITSHVISFRPLYCVLSMVFALEGGTQGCLVSRETFTKSRQGFEGHSGCQSVGGESQQGKGSSRCAAGTRFIL